MAEEDEQLKQKRAELRADFSDRRLRRRRLPRRTWRAPRAREAQSVMFLFVALDLGSVVPWATSLGIQAVTSSSCFSSHWEFTLYQYHWLRTVPWLFTCSCVIPNPKGDAHTQRFNASMFGSFLRSSSASSPRLRCVERFRIEASQSC